MLYVFGGRLLSTWKVGMWLWKRNKEKWCGLQVDSCYAMYCTVAWLSMQPSFDAESPFAMMQCISQHL